MTQSAKVDAEFRSWHTCTKTRHGDCGGVGFSSQVSGSCARAAYPAISPRSGMLKRKDGDQLGINGIYVLGNWHNSAPSWVRRGDKAWYIFRSADRRSWVIDSEAQNGPTCEAVSP
ncbi:unnamed protein product [Effrenium voratum]|nr:unnamed protein product [Effrenium voratum]